MVTEWERPPLAPVTVILYEPAIVVFVGVTVRLELAELPAIRVTEFELRKADGLPDPAGDIDDDRDTLPANPFTLDTTIEEVLELPMLTASAGGLGVRLKSGEGGVKVKNSVIGVAAASLEARLAKFQFASIVFVNE